MVMTQDRNASNPSEPPVVPSGAAEIAGVLAGGAVVALPAVGGYCLAVAMGTPGAEARIEALAADPEGPHYAVGQVDDVRGLTSGWSNEVEQLLERCWPGPVDVFLPRADTEEGDGVHLFDQEDATPSQAWAVTVGMPDGRALRKLCKEYGPWRTIPLSYNDAAEVARAFDAHDLALVVDGGHRDGEPPTLVDATVSPVRVLREGALPADFIDATMVMSARRKLLREGSFLTRKNRNVPRHASEAE
jgi:tRNA A37 threonylcarbamoyladenosine synthetase subunit TsaC/SUA5/YrdC